MIARFKFVHAFRLVALAKVTGVGVKPHLGLQGPVFSPFVVSRAFIELGRERKEMGPESNHGLGAEAR
ncbi:hypothetical protein, partial [Halotalea alkalilenta]|uniref:hypothetical protein n=1 Tax=Halotalea alkalilenta TaxID=376489 RepID=UPI00047F1F51